LCFYATLHLMVSLSGNKLVIIVINISKLLLAAIVEQSEM